MAAGATHVQAYLEKHKISSLFEELMSKIVKDLPADPLEYLVGKIQALQRQKKQGVSPRATSTSTSTSRVRGKIQVTGTAVTPKSIATAKDHLSKSTGIARPVKPRSELVSSSSPSLSKTTPTKSRLPVRSPARPTTASKTSSSAARSSGTPTRPSPDTKRPTTAPAPTTAKSSKLKPPTTSSKTKLSPTTKTTVLKKTVTGDTTKSKLPSSKKVSPSKTAPPPRVAKKDTSSEEIDEFFGEPRKSSPSQLRVDSEDEDSEVDRRHSDSDDSDGVRVRRGDSGDSGHEEDKSLNLEELILKHNRSCKHAKRDQNRKLVHSLLAPPSLDETTPSIGYYSNSEESEDENDGLEMVEDYSALEDEGVTGITRGKYTIREPPSSHGAPKVDLKVLICAQCARVLTGEDQGTEVTRSELTSSSLHTGDFESASQIGSHASFPQWETGSAVDSQTLSAQICRSHDSGSDVTLQSHDTWGGLAPQPRQQAVISDVESEIQLPTPPPLEGSSWTQAPPPQHDAHGWAQHREEEDNH